MKRGQICQDGVLTHQTLAQTCQELADTRQDVPETRLEIMQIRQDIAQFRHDVVAAIQATSATTQQLLRAEGLDRDVSRRDTTADRGGGRSHSHQMRVLHKELVARLKVIGDRRS